MAFKEIEIAFGLTEEWTKAIMGAFPVDADYKSKIESGEYQLHPSILSKRYSEGTSTGQNRLRTAIRKIVQTNLTGFMSKVPGSPQMVAVYNYVSYTNPPPEPPGPIKVLKVKKHSDLVTVATPAWTEKLLAELDTPLHYERFGNLLSAPLFYAICAGCKGRANCYITTPVAGLSLPRYFFEVPAEKKLAFIKTTDVNEAFAPLLGYCLECRVKCGKCGKMLGRHTNPKHAPGLVADGVCPQCGADHLSNVPAPEVSRAMLATISKRIIID